MNLFCVLVKVERVFEALVGVGYAFDHKLTFNNGKVGILFPFK
jgi:hypothetical protein